MPRTKYQLGGPESSSRPFTDREELITAFENAFETLASSRHRVLVYHGVGGIGKTSLIRELRRRLREERPEVAHAKLNFRDSASRLPATALIRLRSALYNEYGVSFPTFDIAFSVYWKLANPHLPLAKSELAFLEEGEIAGDLIGVLADVPVVGLIAKIPSVLEKASRAASEWWTKRGQEELRQIAALDDPTAVAEWLPTFWSADVKAWLEDEPSRRVVLFLDTYEALWGEQNESTRGAPPDDWVRDWAGHLEGVLLVVGGRSKLRWTQRDETWEGLIEQHLVGGLAPEDCERFLKAAGVVEEKVRTAIVEQSEGVPFYLDLAVDTYEQIQEAEGRAPRPDEFDENLDKLLARFLHYLDKAEKAALFKLSVPESFGRERFKDLMRTFGTGYPATADGLEALRQFSFIEEPEPRRYALHALVRGALEAQDDPEERKEVHRHLFERANEALKEVDALAITDGERRALREGFLHGREVMEPKAFLNWYWEAEKPFRQAAEWELLLPLRKSVLRYAEQALGKEHPNTFVSVNNLATALQDRGRYDEAEPLLRRALEGRERVLGEEHPDTLDTREGLEQLLRERGES